MNITNAIFRQWRDQFTSRNDDLRIAICGASGTGKSWRGLRFGYELDPHFNSVDDPQLDKVIFDSDKFYDITSKHAKRGNAYLGDEAGTWMYSRDWHSLINKKIIKAFQTVRHLNQCYILTVPSMRFLDAHLRDMFHYVVECMYKDERKDMVLCKIKKQQHNASLGKTYSKDLRIRGPSGKLKIVRNIWIKPPPDKELIRLYEEKAAVYKRKHRAEDKKEIDKEEKRKKGGPYQIANVDDIIKKVWNNVHTYMKVSKGKNIVNKPLIENRFKIGSIRSKRVVAEIQTKYDEVYDNS